MCPRLHDMVLPLQKILKDEALPEVRWLQDVVKGIWKTVVESNVELSLVDDMYPTT